MYDFWFEFTENSECEGEQFLVECESLEKARVILEMSGFVSGEYRFLGRLTVEEGEWMGLDTY